MTVSPEAMRKALAELAALPAIEVRTTAVLFGIGVHAAYTAAREGRFGAVRFGNQYKFPSAIVRDALGMAQPVVGPAPHAEDTS